MKPHKVTGTHTGRFSCDAPNISATPTVTGRLVTNPPAIQKPPPRTEEMKRIAEALRRPSELHADYSEIEARIAAANPGIQCKRGRMNYYLIESGYSPYSKSFETSQELAENVRARLQNHLEEKVESGDSVEPLDVELEALGIHVGTLIPMPKASLCDLVLTDETVAHLNTVVRHIVEYVEDEEE